MILAETAFKMRICDNSYLTSSQIQAPSRNSASVLGLRDCVPNLGQLGHLGKVTE